MDTAKHAGERISLVLCTSVATTGGVYGIGAMATSTQCTVEIHEAKRWFTTHFSDVGSLVSFESIPLTIFTQNSLYDLQARRF
jgi:hypothetical protein